MLTGVTILVLALTRNRPYLALGWFWYLGTLVPVLGVVQVLGGHAMADRYAYVPLIGLFILLVWGVTEVLNRARRRLHGAGRGQRRSCSPGAPREPGSRSATGVTALPFGGTPWK